MGPMDAFEFKMEGRIAAVKEALARLEADFRLGLESAYSEQKKIDAMHERVR